jgi:mannan endo-1,4-beta-mannosidase
MESARFALPRTLSLLLALSTALSLPATVAAAGHGHHRHHRLAHVHTRKLAGASRVRTSMTTVSPSNSSTVSGTIEWQVKVSGETPTRVDFAIDGAYKGSDTSAPYTFGGGLDTTALGEGSHTLSATAYLKKSKLANAWVTVNVDNVPDQTETTPPAEEPAPTTEEPAPDPEPTPEPEPEPAPAPAPTPASASVFWGAWIGNQLTGNQPPWDMSAAAKFEEMSGKRLSILNFSAPFANCSSSPCSFYRFPANEMNTIRSHGSIPFYSWASQSIPSQKEEPNFQLSDVIAGTYDSYIREWATGAKNWGHPFFLRFNWEMNGRWFPWSEGVNGNKSGEFVTAWRHVHDIFTAVGATNVTWVWCPNIDPGNIFLNLASQYPGDAYVDWTGLDGYNWGTNPAKPDRWRSFDDLYKSTYEKIVGTIAPSKPLMIGEIGSTEYGGSKASWLADMLAKVPAAYPKIRGVLYFEKYDSSMDWPIETSSTATSAFAKGIQSSAYTTNQFGSLANGKIQPPS